MLRDWKNAEEMEKRISPVSPSILDHRVLKVDLAVVLCLIKIIFAFQ